jgi:hypothetical protein
MDKLVFITEVESFYSAVRTESLYNIDMFRLAFITEAESVYSAVRTESDNTDTFSLQRIQVIYDSGKSLCFSAET